MHVKNMTPETFADMVAAFTKRVLDGPKVGGRFVELDRRITQLKAMLAAGPSVKWAGAWNAARTYAEGEFVQKNGLWLALADNANQRPGQSNAWRPTSSLSRDTENDVGRAHR